MEDSVDSSDSDFEIYQDRSGLRDIAVIVYREVWDEFYAWEPDHCQQTISSLAPDAYQSSPVPDLSPETVSTALDLYHAVEATLNIRKTYLILVFYYFDVGLLGFRPYPDFEFCTPASKSIARNANDPDDAHEVPFIPYADNPEFPIREYLTEFPFLGWQLRSNCQDPDRV